MYNIDDEYYKPVKSTKGTISILHFHIITYINVGMCKIDDEYYKSVESTKGITCIIYIFTHNYINSSGYAKNKR